MKMMEEQNARPPEVEEEVEQEQESQEVNEDDGLQSVESEQIDSIYSEGMYPLEHRAQSFWSQMLASLALALF